MKPHARRGLALWLVVCLVAGQASGLLAQAAPGYPARSDGTQPRDTGEYVSDVRSRASLRESLETGWQDARARREAAQRQLEAVRAMQVPPNVDPRVWEEWRTRYSGQLEAYVGQNDQIVGSYQQRLGGLYSSLENDLEYYRQHRTPELSQELGPLIGAGGTAAWPVWRRPTPGNIIGRGQQATRVTQLGTLNSQINTAGSTRDLAVARVAQSQASATATPPAGQTNRWWVDTAANGNVVLRRGDQVIDLKQPAETANRSGGGTTRNDVAFRKAEYYRQLYEARSVIEGNKASLQARRSSTTDLSTIKKLDGQIADLETKRTQLESDIHKYNNDNPKRGSAIGELAGGAAKWALMSAGLTVGSNVVHQLAQNGWNPRSIDWQSAIAPLKTASFWGGTAGSFVGSLVGSMLPGGALIKTLGAIGGAAVGWQLGSGNIANTDWVQLGVSTVGATLGSLLGSAIGGPVGAFLGGIAGQWAANWLLGKLRDHLEQGSQSTPDRQPAAGTDAGATSVDPYTTLSNYLNRGAARSPTSSASAAPSASPGATPSAQPSALPSTPPPATSITSSGTAPAPRPTSAPVPAASSPALPAPPTTPVANNPAALRAEITSTYGEIEQLTRSGTNDPARLATLQSRLVALQQQLNALRTAGPTSER